VFDACVVGVSVGGVGVCCVVSSVAGIAGRVVIAGVGDGVVVCV